MVLNPVTIFHLIGGAHNDALMLGLLVAGVTLAKEKRPIWGIVLCALATAVKAPAALGILYIGWSWLGTGVPVKDRIRPVVTAGLIGVGILGFFSYVSGLGWGWVTILGTPGVVRSWASPTTGIAFAFTGIAHLFHVGVGRRRRPVRDPVPRAAGRRRCAGVWLLLNSDRIGHLKALGLTLLLFVLLGPVVQPWYLSWGLILLAPVALGQLRSLIIGLSMVTAFLELPGGTRPGEGPAPRRPAADRPDPAVDPGGHDRPAVLLGPAPARRWPPSGWPPQPPRRRRPRSGHRTRPSGQPGSASNRRRRASAASRRRPASG